MSQHHPSSRANQAAGSKQIGEDALKLAGTLRNGDLTAVWVPSSAHEALRDLSRACYQSRKDRSRVRHRISKMLLRQGMYRPEHTKTWTLKHRDWLNTVHFPFRGQEIVFREMLFQLDQSSDRVERLDIHCVRCTCLSPRYAAGRFAGEHSFSPRVQQSRLDGLSRPP
ncbi:MAG: hypothetical protein JXA25_20070 [Anaerolineales bacterium]|nr:hypothetical protein [Anaerolineales bacterium]